VPPSRLGLAGHDPADLRSIILPAWDEFCTLARAADLDEPSRISGWSGRDVCVHLGTWPDSSSLARVESDLAQGEASAYDQDEINREVLAAHGSADDDEVFVALHRSRDSVASFLDRSDLDAIAAEPVGSSLGPLPSLTLLMAGGYELAVHALDLVPCGAPAPSRDLLYAGLGALVDVTGALAARHEIEVTASVVTPDGGWRASTEAGEGWTTEAVPAGRVKGAAVEGPLAEVLDVSAGRTNPAALLARGHLKLHGVPTLLRLAPIVENVPGLPGAKPLRGAVGLLSGANRVLRKIPGMR